MSFPKAKLKRFNDVSSATPSPADYNVAQSNHVNGAVISKSERFAEAQSPAVSDTGSTVSLLSNSQFRTPNLPKKSKSYKNRATPTELYKSQEEIEALKDKIVECVNKDQYIKDLTEQIEEMKLHKNVLQTNLLEITEEKDKLATLKEEHAEALVKLSLKHQLQLSGVTGRIKSVHEELMVIKQAYKEFRAQNHANLVELQINLSNFEEFCKRLIESYISEITLKENEIARVKVESAALQTRHEKQLEQAKKQHELEVQNVQFEMLKLVTEMQQKLDEEKQHRTTKLQELTSSYEAKIENLTHDVEARVQQAEENCKEATLLADIQLKEKYVEVEKSWELKLAVQEQQSEAILKECQAISEYNIIQCELEKNAIKNSLNSAKQELVSLQEENLTLSNCRHTLEAKLKSMENELHEIINKYDAASETLQASLEKQKTALTQALNEKHVYEVTIDKTHRTIEALKNRLVNSDNDVEQLKAELEATETSKLEVEGKCNQLNVELQIISQLCDDFEMQQEKAIIAAEERVKSTENRLLERVDYYRNTATAEVDKLHFQLDKTQNELREALTQLEAQQALNSEAQALIKTSTLELERLETVNTDLAFKNQRLDNLVEELREELFSIWEQRRCIEEEKCGLEVMLCESKAATESVKAELEMKLRVAVENLKERIGALQEQNEYYQSQTIEYELSLENVSKMEKKCAEERGRYDAVLRRCERLEKENDELRRTVSIQELLIGPFREQLEAYEMEHNLLLSQKHDAENEARQMGLKYAEILGHQNQKQKIRHLVDLKNKNFELSEGKKELEIKLRSQSRLIEKLKKDLSIAATKSPKKQKVQNQNKENIDSPNRTLNSHRVDSPLRERN